MRNEDNDSFVLQPRFWQRCVQSVRALRWIHRPSTQSLHRLQSTSSSSATGANNNDMSIESRPEEESDQQTLRFMSKKQEKRQASDLNASNHYNNDIDDLEMQVMRYRPEALSTLCEKTNFSKKELQTMYRGFKQECPTGLVDEESFKEIYAHFFPQGDSSGYAHYVFNTFDHDNSGSINFEDFVLGMSILARGTLQERIQWTFSLYDINSDGIITRDEMMSIISSVYEMMGRYTEPIIDEQTTQDHVDRMFEKMDLNQDGVISMDEFMEACCNDENIKHGLTLFDTVI